VKIFDVSAFYFLKSHSSIFIYLYFVYMQQF